MTAVLSATDIIAELARGLANAADDGCFDNPPCCEEPPCSDSCSTDLDEWHSGEEDREFWTKLAAAGVARLSAAGHTIVPSVEPEQADDAYGEPHLNYWPGAGHRSQVWVDHWDGKPVVCHGDPMAYKMIAVDKVQSFAAALLAAAASATMKEPENG